MSEDADPDVCLFDETLTTLLADLARQAQLVEAQRIGAITLYMRQHKLAPGEWRPSDDGRGLVRVKT